MRYEYPPPRVFSPVAPVSPRVLLVLHWTRTKLSPPLQSVTPVLEYHPQRKFEVWRAYCVQSCHKTQNTTFLYHSSWSLAMIKSITSLSFADSVSLVGALSPAAARVEQKSAHRPFESASEPVLNSRAV